MDRSCAIRGILSLRCRRGTARSTGAASVARAARTAGAASADSRAHQRPQANAPPGSFQELGEVLVDRGILEKATQCPVAGLETLGHGAQIGHGGAEITGGLTEGGLAPALHQLPQQSLAMSQFLRDVPEV